jgi:hypothetical protein
MVGTSKGKHFKLSECSCIFFKLARGPLISIISLGRWNCSVAHLFIVVQFVCYSKKYQK